MIRQISLKILLALTTSLLVTLASGWWQPLPTRAATSQRYNAEHPRLVYNLDRHWLIDKMPAFHLWRKTAVLSGAQIAKLHCPAIGRGWTPVQIPNDYIAAGTITRNADNVDTVHVDRHDFNRSSRNERQIWLREFSPSAYAKHGFLPVYPVWYRRTFTLPMSAKGKTIWLNFGGVYRDSVVFINGQPVGQHPSGYTGFRYNISKFVHTGQPNTLTVFVDPRFFEGWFYEGGGIYRHVRLMITDKLHVAPWGTFVISKVPGTIHYSASDGDYADAHLAIQTTVNNAHKAGRQFTLVSRILGPDGQVLQTISNTEVLAAGVHKTFIQHTALRNAALWSLKHCNLYHLQTRLEVRGKVVDDKRTTFGIRTLRFDPNQGFFLDGKHVEIDGTCNHQVFPGVGIAAPDNLWPWRIAKLKAMGCNAYRTAHNPLASAFYRACNHLGMLVMDENRHLGDAWTAKSPRGTLYSNLSDLKAMILQHRNYPCIIFWSMCNEEGKLQGTREGARIFTAMMQAVHRLDPTRPVTSAMDAGYNAKGFFSVENLLGINYHCRLYPAIHQNFPSKMIFGSEDFNTYSTRGALTTNRKSGVCTEFGDQLRHSPNPFQLGHTPWRSWAPMAEHPFAAGEFVWTGFDYPGVHPLDWPAVMTQTGCMDLCGFPKPCYYYWRAWWRKKPSVYLFPAWTFSKSMAGQPIKVRCYSNCDRITLFLNGQNLGAKNMPKYKYLDWTVPYAPGVLTARGFDHGRDVAQYAVLTCGPAAAIELIDQYPHLAADGESIAPIAVKVVDPHGHVVPDADNPMRFTISGAGALAGVANGDPASHGPVGVDCCRAFHGLCMVMARAGNKAGTITLTATSPSLKSAAIEITASRRAGTTKNHIAPGLAGGNCTQAVWFDGTK